MPTKRRKSASKNKPKQNASVEVITERLRRTKTFTENIADGLTESFGSAWFFILNGLLFGFWIVANENWIPGIPAFDPYPYGLLTMAVSLEAIFLSIIVLISQNREAQISSVRDEVDFQVSVNSEKEITQILNVLDGIEKKMHIVHRNTREIQKMKEQLDLEAIREAVELALKTSNGTRKK